MPLPAPFEARLVSARSLSPSVRELTFERLDGRAMQFEPGQWVNVLGPAELALEPAVGGVKRSYSIASAPGPEPRFDLAVTRVQDGPVSSWLHALAEGTVIPFVGPQGFFVRPAAKGPPALMIATGTGVTPMRSMVLASAAAGDPAPTWMLLGVRREADVLYASELEDLSRRHPALRFEVTLSRPEGAWSGRRGYVQSHARDLWEELTRAAAVKPHVYVCGLQRMVGSVRDLFRKDLGLPRDQVHTERYD